MDAALPFTAAPGGVKVVVRVSPKAGQDSLDGLMRDASGQPMLKARVTAAPEHGMANAALIALLARAWDVPKSRLSVISGPTSRTKTLLVQGEPQTLMLRLENWLREALPA